MGRDEAVRIALEIPGMTTQNELEFLYDLAEQATVGSDFIELGTYMGRTLSILSYVARAKEKRVISVDNYSYDSKCSLALVRHNLLSSGFETELSLGKILLFDQDSRDKLSIVENTALLFIDSHHLAEQFNAEMSTWLDTTVKNGIVVCHDYSSPTWLEMTAVINHWLMNNKFKKLGIVRRMIGFRKLYDK